MSRLSRFPALLLFCLLMAPWRQGIAHADYNAVQFITSLTQALSQQGAVQIRKNQSSGDWLWVQAALFDEPTPLVLDFVVSKHDLPGRIVYMLPGGGLNFQSDFFTPTSVNLAHFLRVERDALIVGITPREDSVAAGSDLSIMANWGLAKHKQDVAKVISVIDALLRVRFDVIGHSGGGLIALDYASTSSSNRFRELMVLEMIGPYNPTTEATQVAQAQATSNAYAQLLAGGTFASDNIAQVKQLVGGAAVFPNADSGVPRFIFGGPPGNFTLEGLMFFSLINTNLFPGLTTPITGLPESWYYSPGFLAGTYTFSADPTMDGHTFTQSNLGVVQAGVAAIGSGLVPTALLRDTLAIFAGSGAYTIAFRNIDERTTWVNGALGLGNHDFGARLIRQGGNNQVQFKVIPGYGHADVVFGTNAAHDVWHFFD